MAIRTSHGAPFLHIDRLQAGDTITLLAASGNTFVYAVTGTEVVDPDDGAAVIPTVDAIRSKFTSRRTGGNPLDQLLKKLLGLDAKMRQYQDGAAFVRRVVDRVGMEGFNKIWTAPNTLPTKTEIANPDAWVTRLHG